MSRTGPKPSSPVRPSLVPPLQPGDHLTRAEFERRYDATPNLQKAELIEGVVYMAPPVSCLGHSSPHAQLVTWIGNYVARTPHVLFGDNGSLRLDLDNMPQPDVFMMIDAEHGGQAKIDVDDYVSGAPEFIGEVSASSVSYDLHTKLNAYRRNGVREYLVWRTQQRAIDYFILTDGEYRQLVPDEAGLLRSQLFGGLWLRPGDLIEGRFESVLDLVGKGITSPEHAAFTERLNRPISP